MTYNFSDYPILDYYTNHNPYSAYLNFNSPADVDMLKKYGTFYKWGTDTNKGLQTNPNKGLQSLYGRSYLPRSENYSGGEYRNPVSYLALLGVPSIFTMNLNNRPSSMEEQYNSQPSISPSYLNGQ